MTNREKFIEVFGDNPQRHNITKSWWDEEYVPPQEPKTDYKAFAEWVATEIFDDMWEYNKDAFAEIACRKLAKLGIVIRMGDEWVLVEPQENEDNDSENKEIKEILIMFIKHIKYGGDLYPFNFKEQDRLIEITNKWLNEENK